MPGWTLSGGDLDGSARQVIEVLRAAQAIGSGLELVGVLERTMTVALAVTGAQRGCLLVRRGDRLNLEVRMHTAPEALLEVGSAVEERGDIALAVVRAVADSRQTVVLTAAEPDPRFAGDPYLERRAPSSLLCAALTNGERLIGVLQLESGEAVPLAPARLALLELVSRQAAISIESASLHRDLRSATALLRDAVEQLEQLVDERTAELHRANAMLRDEMQVRAREEQERERLQAEIIRMQQARLRELSTPLIPITDRVVVMPLIGAMDQERAEQVVEVALSGAAASGASVVIMDVTGLTEMDSRTADTLARCARALELLGAEVVLTGIQPRFAGIMVEQGIDLDMTTQLTLQRGIAYAMRRTAGQGVSPTRAGARPRRSH